MDVQSNRALGKRALSLGCLCAVYAPFIRSVHILVTRRYSNNPLPRRSTHHPQTRNHIHLPRRWRRHWSLQQVRHGQLLSSRRTMSTVNRATENGQRRS